MNIFKKKALLYKYLVVGVITVLIDILLLFICFKIFHMDYILASAIGIFTAMIFQFLVNYFFTFRLKKGKEIAISAILYFIFAFIGNVLALLIIEYIYNIVENLFYAKILSLIFNFIYGFTVSKYIIYNRFILALILRIR